MSKIRYVAKKDLANVPLSISQLGLTVLVPVISPATAKPSIIYEPWEKEKEFTFAKAFVSPKSTVFPECETLFEYKKRPSPVAPDENWIQLSEKDERRDTVIFGCRPCDARGFDALDKPFTQGLFKDPYYAEKRDHIIVIARTCNTGCETCFCHWVGGGPTSPIGSDILITELEDGFVFQAITEKGQDLLTRLSMPDGTDKFPEAEEIRKKAWKSLVPAPDISGALESLKNIFTDDDFWVSQTDRCISCGACTYICPTCYCFNITDEGVPGSPKGGRRLRSWDNCMSSRYTREASGHNPRAKKFQRMRNRVSHKFWTFPENWGSYLCSGCGRCITNCPVHLDIRAIVLAAIEEYRKKKGADS
ncbi:MAG: 4Fe-4S dicluster domain-containing protein [Desulfovibrio sp.]|nr:4Fe-4S dicluster domain-containing protein [Desulfovibrio sp.]